MASFIERMNIYELIKEPETYQVKMELIVDMIDQSIESLSKMREMFENYIDMGCVSIGYFHMIELARKA